MRRYETATLIAIGALFTGAYLLGTERFVSALLPDSPYPRFSDSVAIATHMAWSRRALVLIALMAAIYGMLLRIGGPRLRATAAVVAVIWCLCLALALAPLYLTPLDVALQSYLDNPTRLPLAVRLSDSATYILPALTPVLPLLLLIAGFQRLRRRLRHGG